MDSVTVTLSDGPGNSGDWLALARVGDPVTSYLQWIYVGAGATTATWTVTMPATLGDYEFRLFENGGFKIIGTSSARSATTCDPRRKYDYSQWRGCRDRDFERRTGQQ
jgi:hypothetical protein